MTSFGTFQSSFAQCIDIPDKGDSDKIIQVSFYLNVLMAKLVEEWRRGGKGLIITGLSYVPCLSQQLKANCRYTCNFQCCLCSNLTRQGSKRSHMLK